MKTRLTFLMAMMTMAVASSAQAAPSFVELKADKPAYTVGERAILTSYVKIRPDNPNYEIYLSATLNGAKIKITKITEKEAVSITPRFIVEGAYEWQVDVYLQDKKTAADLNAMIVFYEEEIFTLNRELEEQTDPEKVEMLTAHIQRDEQIIAAAREQLEENRRKIETQVLNIDVAAVKNNFDSQAELETPVFSLEKDKDGCGYNVGESAMITASLKSEFNGSDGAQEAVMTGRIADVVLFPVQISKKEFIFTTDIFTVADIGEQTFEATLYIRSKARADALRDAITKASQRRADFIEKRDRSEDPAWKAYYQREIDDLTNIIDEFYRQLDEMLTLVGASTIIFCVKE
ncbi:MAG: hypothetical protein A3K03_11630 [Bdellovibrionales bacterium RIFOXYD1_FULL_44_7]|nr:MAG: hypothetical protein A3K03_11630 [Bdellovibrionales bacterium RIFOXYD1_FULL_44_7]